MRISNASLHWHTVRNAEESGRDRSLVGIRFEALRSVVVIPSSLLFVLLLLARHIRAAARFSCLVSDRAGV
jgi:hypothetical protein